jgi:AAA+ ATPase superfamily predicted ATPase
MRKPVNPFILSGYHSPRYFCDRESELTWLLEQFGNERNAVIHSWRRIGKTALLRHFFYHLELKKKAECVFVDLLGTASLNDANKRIASAIVQRFGEPKKPIGAGLMKLIGSLGATVGLDPFSGTPQVTFGLAPARSVSASMEAMGKFIAESKKPVVICLDEFQQVINYPEANAEAVFRTWVQDFPMVRFIFSGSHRNMMVSMFSEKARPFYRSAQIRQLDPLSHHVYEAFVRSHFKKAGKGINTGHINRVFEWTRMQTYYVQLVFNKVYGKAEQVTDELIDEVFSEIIQQEVPQFSNYQLLLTSFQWKLLVAIARAENVENPTSQSFLAGQGLGAASSVSAALRMLEKKEFVIYVQDKYTLHDTLLMRWLQRI